MTCKRTLGFYRWCNNYCPNECQLNLLTPGITLRQEHLLAFSLEIFKQYKMIDVEYTCMSVCEFVKVSRWE